jgi:pimeloyl-ACP methyl ester carboxylesterase
MGTYYTMKERAGAVGTGGLTDLLRLLADMATGIPVTLVGHSFGARVVSAAAGNGAPAHAMCLLQGAFSHYGFDNDQGPLGKAGAFRSAVQGGALEGPIVVTHSHKDLAVRLAYAIASRIAQQTASGLGDENDRYGGLGANGAVGMPSAEVQNLDLGPVGTTYPFAAHKIYNLTGDAFISGHSAVDGPEVANAVRQAALSQL